MSNDEHLERRILRRLREGTPPVPVLQWRVVQAWGQEYQNEIWCYVVTANKLSEQDRALLAPWVLYQVCTAGCMWVTADGSQLRMCYFTEAEAPEALKTP